MVNEGVVMQMGRYCNGNYIVEHVASPETIFTLAVTSRNIDLDHPQNLHPLKICMHMV